MLLNNFVKPLLVFSLVCACSSELEERTYTTAGAPAASIPAEEQSFGEETARAGAELLAYALVPIMLLALPVIVPVEYAVSQSDVVQPVNVVSANGEPKGVIFKKPEDVFVQTGNSVVCSGEINKPAWDSQEAAALKCDKKKKAVLETEWTPTTRVATVFVGPVSFEDTATGKTTELSLECKGKYNKTDGEFQPFKLACARGAEATIIPGKIKDGIIPVEFMFNLPPD